MFETGKCYFVRTVTDHWIGRCVESGPHSITLRDAAWIADSGRLSEFLSQGRTDQMEIEPVPDGVNITIQWLAVLDWTHALFREAV